MRLPLAVAAALCSVALAGAESRDPEPTDATQAVVDAFDRYDVVGMNAAHSNKLQDDFILSLVQDPRLAGKVNDIALECGNSRYQALLDRYIAGEDVPVEQARQVWRDTSVGMCSVSGFVAEFYPLVREINKKLPAAKRFRVLALEPPTDWSADPATIGRGSGDRNASMVAVMTSEVFAKKRKALVLCGVGHLYHADAGSATATWERSYPASRGRTFVIQTHQGFAAFIDLDRGRELEAKMHDWPRPSIVSIKGTWLADLDLPYFMWPFPRSMAGEAIADKADAYLYLGPGDALLYEKTPASILDDDAYMAQVSKRFAIDPASLRKRNDYAPLYTTADRQEARQFAPGAEFVGRYASATGSAQTVEIDFHAGKLSAKLTSSSDWVTLASAGVPARYRVDASTSSMTLEFDTGGGEVVIDSGSGQPKVTLRRVR